MQEGNNQSDIYVIIGARIRALRIVHGISQEILGREISVTFQQIQKYERGINQVSIAKLLKISHFFAVPFQHFIPELFSHEADQQYSKLIELVQQIKQKTSPENSEWWNDVVALIENIIGIPKKTLA